MTKIFDGQTCSYTKQWYRHLEESEMPQEGEIKICFRSQVAKRFNGQTDTFTRYMAVASEDAANQILENWNRMGELQKVSGFHWTYTRVY